MPDAAATTSLATLSACCELAEAMLLRCFQHLNQSPATTLNALGDAVDVLARVTAVRKSLIHLSERPSPDHGSRPAATHDEPPAPSPSNSVSETDNRQPSIVTNSSPDLPISNLQQTHQIHDIPAMPLDRIQGALTRVMTDLARQQSDHQQASQASAQPISESEAAAPEPQLPLSTLPSGLSLAPDSQPGNQDPPPCNQGPIRPPSPTDSS